jgi:oxygen-independent coproporphyrinogen-3 oxidase
MVQIIAESREGGPLMTPKIKFIKKIIIMGEGGVGKTSLISQYVSGKFTNRSSMTIDCDFFTKKIKLNTEYMEVDGTLSLWDLSGQSQFRPLIEDNMKGAHAIILIYDMGRLITLEKLKVLKTFGVTRISINPQSMRQKTLDIIGRKHTVTQVAEAFLMARSVGHDNINMDIILGLPGEGCEDVAYTLSEIDKLQPDSLTVHTLAIKRAARLNIEKDNYRDMASTETTQMLKLTADYTKKADYLPYYLYRQKNMSDNLENIGYAKFGKEGLYNILIMEEKQTILALGAGALSKFVYHEENRIERVENVKSLKDYIERIDEMIERKKQFLMLNP